MKREGHVIAISEDSIAYKYDDTKEIVNLSINKLVEDREELKTKFKKDFKYASIVFNAPRNNNTVEDMSYVWEWIEENIL